MQANEPPTSVQHRRIKAGQTGSQERLTLIKKQIQLILVFFFFFFQFYVLHLLHLFLSYILFSVISVSSCSRKLIASTAAYRPTTWMWPEGTAESEGSGLGKDVGGATMEQIQPPPPALTSAPSSPSTIWQPRMEGGLQWRDTHDTLRRDYAVITEEELNPSPAPTGRSLRPLLASLGIFSFFFSLRSLSKNNHPNKLSTLSLEGEWINKGWDGVSGSARGREEGSEAEGFWWSFLLWKSIRWKAMDPALITVVHYNMSSRA